MAPMSLVRLAIIALALLLAACAASGPVERDRYYRLSPAEALAIAPAGRPVAATLRVDPLAARGFLGGREIVYRTGEAPHEVQRHQYHLWETPPAVALADALVEALRAARLFEFVADRSGGGRADYLLDGTLRAFEHHPDDRSARVVVAFDLILSDARTRRTRLMRSYRGEEPLAADDPSDMVAAFERLTARLIGEAVRDLQAERPRLVAGGAR